MKCKVLYVNLFPEIGGAETSLLYLLQKLDRNIFEPYVIVPKEGYFSERLKKLKIKIVYLELPGFLIRELFVPGADPVAILRFYRICKRLRPDLIHLNHITQAFYAGVASKLLKIPVVGVSWMNSDTVYFYQDLLYQFSCTKILPITSKLSKRLIRRKIINKKKVLVSPPGVDTYFFKPIRRVTKKYVVITIASRFDPVKDHITFFRAMNIVVKKFPNIKILVAQDPKINLEDKNISANQVKSDIDKYLEKHPHLKKMVIFTGYKKDMRDIYNITDILVSSSLYESIGIILVEAASCGIPIVSTNFDTQYLAVKNNITGFLVPIQKPEDMAKKILLLARSSKSRRAFGKAARRHILENFRIERYVNDIQKVYLSLIPSLKKDGGQVLK